MTEEPTSERPPSLDIGGHLPVRPDCLPAGRRAGEPESARFALANGPASSWWSFCLQFAMSIRRSSALVKQKAIPTVQHSQRLGLCHGLRPRLALFLPFCCFCRSCLYEGWSGPSFIPFSSSLRVAARTTTRAGSCTRTGSRNTATPTGGGQVSPGVTANGLSAATALNHRRRERPVLARPRRPGPRCRDFLVIHRLPP
jgi:hypothetical protein